MQKRTFTPHIQLTEDVTPERVDALAERSGMKKQHLYMLLIREGLKVLEPHINVTMSGTPGVPGAVERERTA